MAEISEIYFKVESSQLKKAVGDLESLNVAATNVTFSVGKLGSASRKNANDTAKETAEVNKNTTAHRRNNAAVEEGTKLRGKARRVERAATGYDPLTGKMARDLGVNRFNTANIAAQFQDIGVTAAMGMNPMTIALQQGTQLSAILNNMGNPLKGLAQAFTQLINPVALLSIGITGLIAVLVQMVDWSKVWETASGLLVKGLQFIKENADILTKSLLVLTSVAILTRFRLMGAAVASLAAGFADLVVFIAPIALMAVKIIALAGAFYGLGQAVGNFLGFDFLTGLKDTLNMLITMFVNGLKVITNAFKIWWNDLKNIIANVMNSLVSVAKTIESVSLSIPSLFDDGEYLAGRIKEYEGIKQEIRKMLTVDEDMLLNRDSYLIQGVESFYEPTDYVGNFTENVKSGIDWALDKLTNTAEDVDKKMKEAWDKIVKGVEGHKIEMTQEADLLGRIGEDYHITKEKYDLLNQAREAGITLTAEQIKYIEEESVALGKQADALDKLNKKFEFAKSTTNSFFTDMNHALIEGEKFWDAFGNAVMNVLTKILDKMNEVGVDLLFGAMKSAGWFGTNAAQVYNSPIGPTTSGAPMAALGGVWNKGVQKFATGGVVSSPTTFGTRSGLGLMGEAGPEAIMPLTRGANGELGVKAEGTATAPVVVNVINNANAKATVNQRQTSQGTEIDVMIDQMVADKLGTLGSASNTAMNTWNNRQLIAR